ncbi:hypothetical protein, partial [Microbispora triticiradicis]|uniref:hypothetical protein n=1 Tax=Microbispora triticiradicis TaxID=2200763 RepID=UPI001AD7B2F2
MIVTHDERGVDAPLRTGSRWDSQDEGWGVKRLLLLAVVTMGPVTVPPMLASARRALNNGPGRTRPLPGRSGHAISGTMSESVPGKRKARQVDQVARTRTCHDAPAPRG